MKLRRGPRQMGQTSIEYMLVLVVSVGLGITFFKKVDGWLISNPRSIIGNQLNSFKKILKQDPKYKRFSVPR